MNQKKQQQSSDSVQFRIEELRKIRYFENNHEDYGITEKIDLASIKVDAGFEISEELESLVIKLKVVFLKSPEEENQQLFGIETLSRYRIKDFKKYFKEGDKTFGFPEKALIHFIALSISSTRGMLAVLNTNPAYQHMILPPLDPKPFIENLSKKIREKDTATKSDV